MARKKLGILLEEKGIINEFQLVAALSHQRKWKIRLGKALQECGFIQERKLFEVLAEQWGMELVDLEKIKIPEEIKRKIDRDKAMALMAVPVREELDTLVVAVSEPDRPNLKEELEKITGMKVRLVLAMDSQVEEISRTLPEKIPVASVKPVKKAFRKNEQGDIELVEKELENEAAFLEQKEIIEKQREEPIPLDDEPVALEEEIVQEPEVQPSAEIKTETEPLNVEVPELIKTEPSAEPEIPIQTPPEKIAPEPEQVIAERTTVGEDTEELWESAQTMPEVEKPPEKPEIKEEAPPEEILAESKPEEKIPIEESSASADFYPGQMRELEPEPPEETPVPKPEEEVVELSKETLLAGEKIEPAPPEELPPPIEIIVPPLTEPRKEEPVPGAEAIENIPLSSEPSQPLASELDKKEILQSVKEIESQLEHLQKMILELKQKLES